MTILPTHTDENTKVLAKWDSQGRFVCPFSAEYVTWMHALYVELKNSTTPNGQNKFKHLYFDVGEHDPIHHSEVVFEKPEDLARYIRDRTNSQHDRLDRNKYSLTGHPVICLVRPITNEREKIEAVSNFFTDKLRVPFAGVTVPNRFDPTQKIKITTVIDMRHYDTIEVNSRGGNVVATLNAALERRGNDWLLVLPVVSKSCVTDFQSSLHVGTPGLHHRG